METALSVLALLVLIGVLSSVGGKLLSKKQGASWLVKRSSAIGWLLLIGGISFILYGFVIDGSGSAMSAKLALGSLLAIAGLWLIW